MKETNKSTLLVLACLLLASSMTGIAQNKKSDWTAFNQHIEVEATQKLRFKLIATVTADVVRRKGKAGIWVRVDNKNGGVGFFENMQRKPIRLNAEKEYIIEGVIDENSKKLFFGGLAWGNGTFTFDKFELFIENSDTNELEPVQITNGSFETTASNNRVEGWNIKLESRNNLNDDGFFVSLVDIDNKKSKAVQIIGEGK